MSNYTLTYSKEKSQEIYIENIGNGHNESLYFNQEYKDARKLIKEIVDSQGTKNDEPEKRKEKRNKIKKYGCNNRILFTGQRGCGKTSVMRSLADYLSSEDIEINSEKYPKDDDGVPYVVKFSCLPMVDPSHFDNNNNILLTVITSMFSEAKKKMNDDKDGGDTSYREELLKQFEKVFKSLDSIKSEVSSYTLESLNRKSDAEDLKDKMKDLVNKYLRFKGCGDGDGARLVLLIDDIDMSVSYASEMLEQLRKYLELDNLVILMSANLGQLSNEMREKYSSAFQYTLKDSNQALSIDVEDLATKYLLKLFPTSRRINVERHVEQLLKTNLIVEGWNDNNKNENQTDNSKTKDDGSQGEGDFQKVILSLIWSKTRLLFIPKDSKNTLHPIIPTNLRDLAQFLDMLTSLPNVRSKYLHENTKKEEPKLFAYKKDYEDCEHNLQVFKNYVMKTWIPNHLKVDEELVFHNIPTDITEINKHLINSINKIGTLHKKELMSREVGLDIIERNADNVFIDRDIYTMVSPNDPKFVKANKISDIFNQPSNYSYGDLLLMIDKYETYFESEEHRKFTDAIKIYYSILLFETLFFKSNKVKYTEKDFDKLNEDEKILPIQRLLGGTVYYPNYFEIITSKHFSQKGPSFDAKRAFYHKVELPQKGGNYVVGDNYPLFSVLYYGDIRPDRYDNKHIYDTTFKGDADVDEKKYVTFDILSILSNMLNPWHTISRANGAKAARTDVVNDIITVYNDDDFIAWKTKCEIDSNCITPNTILPFYSVDIMLQYLNKSIPFEDVNDKVNGIKTTNEGKDYDYTLLNCQEKNELQRILKDEKYKETSLSEYLTNGKLTTTIDIKVDGIIITQKIIPENNAEILKKAREVYKRIYSLSPLCLYEKKYHIADSYKDHVMALVLSDFQGSTKDREQLIKNLHTYDTFSELFEYLYSVLYKDAFRAKTVRSNIQGITRSREFVHYYYNILWNNTEKMLENVTINNSANNPGIMPVKVYKGIYSEAIKCFVMKPDQEGGQVNKTTKKMDKKSKNIEVKTTKRQKK